METIDLSDTDEQRGIGKPKKADDDEKRRAEQDARPVEPVDVEVPA